MTNAIVTGPQFAWNIASRLTRVARFIAGALPENSGDYTNCRLARRAI